MDQDNEWSRENSHPDLGTMPQGVRRQQAARAAGVASDMFDDAVARFMNINRTDARCMDIIDRLGRMTAGQLAKASGLTTGAVTVMVDRLANAGYVARERDLGDRRKVWISMTPEANAISRALFSHYRMVEPVVQARFTPDQMAAIIEYLEVGAEISRRYAALLEQHIEPGPMSQQLLNAQRFEQAAHASMVTMIETLKARNPLS